MFKSTIIHVTVSAILLLVLHSAAVAQSPEEHIKAIGGWSTTAVVSVDLGSSGHARDAADLRALVPTLKQLPYLQELSLPFLIDDDALIELQPLLELKALRLVACQVTDEGVKHLLALEDLRTLQLTRTKITDAGMKTVAKLGRLRDLDISITAVTDKGLEALTSLKDVTRLDISYNKGITDAGIESVIQMEGLEILWVYGTHVTDAGLMRLTELKQLRELKIFRTKVTESGINEFKKRMPSCKVSWGNIGVESR